MKTFKKVYSSRYQCAVFKEDRTENPNSRPEFTNPELTNLPVVPLAGRSRIHE